MAEHHYSAPDTSDKLPDETWQEYWDRKMDERHGEDCNCALHQYRRILKEHSAGCKCPPCAANQYFKSLIE